MHTGSELFREYHDFHFPLNLGNHLLSCYGEKEHVDEILVNYCVLPKAPNFPGKKNSVNILETEIL